MRDRSDTTSRDQSWIELFERIATAIRATTGNLYGTEKGREKLAIGAGGDRTLQLDRVAEAVALKQLEAAESQGLRFSVLSEETGSLRFGADLPLFLLDPVDGSTNASRGLPIFAVMMALANQANMGDVQLGFVEELRTGVTWSAIRGRGAYRNGKRLEPERRESDDLVLVGLEGKPRSLLMATEAFGQTEVRVLGSLATSIMHLATGGFDVVCAVSPMRVFDMSASLLLVHELGGLATDIQGKALDHLHLDLETKSTLVAALTPRAHDLAMNSLQIAGLP